MSEARPINGEGRGRHRERRTSTGDRVFAAFISYSHAVDGRLAPALASALQGFAKPWYRLRALRVFHDESTLAATPELWPSIARALDSSEFFVLLASPEAASSPWVAREVEHWLDHRPAAQLLVALTAGEIAWDDERADFDWGRTTAIPRAVTGVFAQEPRYVDLRWARSVDDLSVENPDFRSAVADLAAPLHHRDKDELLGEAVRQHRRTLRLARIVVAVIAILAILATAAGLLAVSQRNAARDQRDLARSQTLVATSRQLAAESATESSSLDRSLLLAAQALSFADTSEARGALLSAIQRSPRLVGFIGRHAGPAPGFGFSPLALAFSPDGRTLATAGSRGVTTWSVARRRAIARFEAPRRALFGVQRVTFSRDGRTLGITLDSKESPRWRVATGRLLRPANSIESSGGITATALSPDTTILAAEDENGSRIAFWSTTTGRRLQTSLPSPTRGRTSGLAFTPDGRRLLVGGEDARVTVWDLTTSRRLGAFRAAPRASLDSFFQLRFAFDATGHRAATLTQDGTVSVWDLTTFRRIAGPVRETEEGGVALSPDGRLVAIGRSDGSVVLWDLRRRQPEPPLLGHGTAVTGVAFSPDSRSLASVGDDGKVLLWTTAAAPDLGRVFNNPDDLFFGAGNVAFSPDGALLAATSSLRLPGARPILVWDARSRLQYFLLGRGPIAFTPNGQLLFWQRDRLVSARLGGHGGVGPVAGGDERGALSPSGRALARFEGEWLDVWDLDHGRRVARTKHGIARLDEVQGMAFSGDDEALGIGFGTGRLSIWSRNNPGLVDLSRGQGFGISTLALDATGTHVAAADATGIVVWNIASRRAISHPALAFTRRGGRFSADQLAFSRDGRLLAASDGAGDVVLWDGTGRSLVGELRIDDAHRVSGSLSDLVFSPDSRFLAVSGARPVDQEAGRLGPGRIVLWDVDVDSWRRKACTLANRDLTRDEWNQFVGTSWPYEPSCAR